MATKSKRRIGLDVASKPSSAGIITAKTDAVVVAVRERPLSSVEASQGSETCVDVVDASVLLADKQFDFDAAFPATSQQESVYSTLVAPMVDQFFDGYNATVFAYGQTGSGKTFTMGNEFTSSVVPTERGVIPRVIESVFKRVSHSANPQHFVIKLSYLEILNEEVRDLLAKSSTDTPLRSTAGLSVRGDGDRGIIVAGLSEHVVNSTDQARDLLRSGALVRATASTNMNAQSSRSHAICTIAMDYYEASAAEGGTETRFSKFHLVDLAGSERVQRTNSEGERFKEGVNINRGLLALGNVINALCERSRTAHIPYRDSKLTRLLQDSLGGNSKTLMIACISPADINYEETSSTLRYASRARNIENQAVINKERSAENEVAYLKQQLEIVQLQLLEQTQALANGSLQREDRYSWLGHGNKRSPSSVEILEKENRKLKAELLLSNSTKDKWKKIAEELRGKNKEASRTSLLTTPTPAKALTAELISDDKRVEGNKSSHMSRLEQLKKYQAQKGKSLAPKDDGAIVKRRTEDITVTNKRARTLASPSPSTSDIGRKRLFARRVLSSPGGGFSDNDGQPMWAMTALLQQVMASQEVIYRTKEAVRAKVADRTALACKISRLEALQSAENAEKLASLQNDLRKMTVNIRSLQQKLAKLPGFDKSVALPPGLFPPRLDTCHDLIQYVIEALLESKEEYRTLSNFRVEKDATKEKVVSEQNLLSTKDQWLQMKLEAVMKELQDLREQTTKKKAAKKRKTRESYETIEMLFSSSDEEEDNFVADPDYVEEKGGTKRKRGNKVLLSKNEDDVDVMDEIDELLETSVASRCSCYGKCATKACACKSQSRVCSPACSCSSGCRNKENSDTPGAGGDTSISQLSVLPNLKARML